MKIENRKSKPSAHRYLAPHQVVIPENKREQRKLRSYHKSCYRPTHKLLQIVLGRRNIAHHTYRNNKYQTKWLEPDRFHTLNNWYWHKDLDLSEEDWRRLFYTYRRTSLWDTYFLVQDSIQHRWIKDKKFSARLEFHTKGTKPCFDITHKSHHLDPWGFPKWHIYVSTKVNYLPHLQQYHLLLPSLIYRYLEGYLKTDGIKYFYIPVASTLLLE